jgi:hypothetical protein
MREFERKYKSHKKCKLFALIPCINGFSTGWNCSREQKSVQLGALGLSFKSKTEFPYQVQIGCLIIFTSIMEEQKIIINLHTPLPPNIHHPLRESLGNE